MTSFLPGMKSFVPGMNSFVPRMNSFVPRMKSFARRGLWGYGCGCGCTVHVLLIVITGIGRSEVTEQDREVRDLRRSSWAALGNVHRRAEEDQDPAVI